MAAKKNPGPELHPRFRIIQAETIVLGPGKAELLQHITDTGSLNQAAKLMRMSYMRAWQMVGIMNRRFKKPLVSLERGGRNGGGAELTETGQRVLTLYQQMHQIGIAATKPQWTRLRQLLKKGT